MARNTIHTEECVEVRPLISVAAVIVAALFLTSCTTSKGDFTLVNRAKEPIVRASVEICGQTIQVTDVQPSKSATGSYEVKADSHYTIQVEFQSGKKLRKETGYVTRGMDFKHEISVSDSGIEIVDSKAK